MTDVAAPTIGGTVEPGFEAVRDAFVRNFTEHGERRRGRRRARQRQEGGRPLGRRRRSGDRSRLRRPTRCSSSSPPRKAPRRCASRCSRSGARSTTTRRSPTTGPSSPRRARARSPCAQLMSPPGWPPGDRPHAHARRGLRVDAGHRGARRAGARVGAGHGARLPRRHVRLSRGRARAPHQRQEPRHVLRRRGRDAARDSTSGSGCRSRRSRAFAARAVTARRRPRWRRSWRS